MALTVAARVKAFRLRQKMSAQQLADATSELGHPIPRSVLANLESGRRGTVTVADLLVLAKALGVPPVLLLYAPGVEPRTEVLPGQYRVTESAVRWFTGASAFPAADDPERPAYLAHYFVGTDQDNQAYADNGMTLVLGDDHARKAKDLAWEMGRVPIIQAALDDAEDDRERDAHRARMSDAHRQIRAYAEILREARQQMRKAAIVPPRLPREMAEAVRELAFVVYERADQDGRIRERRTVERNSDEDYQLNASRPWWQPLDIEFPRRPNDFNLDDDQADPETA